METLQRFSSLWRSGFYFQLYEKKQKQFWVEKWENDLSQNNQKMKLMKLPIQQLWSLMYCTHSTRIKLKFVMLHCFKCTHELEHAALWLWKIFRCWNVMWLTCDVEVQKFIDSRFHQQNQNNRFCLLRLFKLFLM